MVRLCTVLVGVVLLTAFSSQSHSPNEIPTLSQPLFDCHLQNHHLRTHHSGLRPTQREDRLHLARPGPAEERPTVPCAHFGDAIMVEAMGEPTHQFPSSLMLQGNSTGSL